MTPARAVVSLALALLAAALLAAAPASAASGPPALGAKSAIVIDGDNGEVLFARGADKERPIASTTKLMTALLTLEHTSLSDVITAPPYQAAPAESKIGLRAGERMAVRDLLRALLLPSANDAAATLAQGVAGSTKRFVREMNQRARRLHLAHTHYSNPVGLDVGHNYSSARDLVTLARELRRNAFFRHTTNLAKAKLRTGDRPRTVVNRNNLVGSVPFVNGVKTGHTNQAGYVLVGSGTKKGVTVISAVLGDGSEAARNADTLALLNYGLSQLKRITPVKRGQRLGTAKVRYRESDTVPLVAGETVRQVVKRGTRAQVTVAAPDVIEGPKASGERVGTAVVRVRGKVVARVPVLTGAPVPEVGIFERLFSGPVGPIIVVLAVLAIVVGSVLVAMARRRKRQNQRAERSEQVGAA